jgi:hypothetical protein
MRINRVRVLRARAQVRAILFYKWAEYEDLEQAIKPLREYAINCGLADNIGAATVMAIIYAAFDLPPNGDVSNNSKITVSRERAGVN